MVQKEGYDLLIVDSAGRLHIDEGLMKELIALKKLLSPSEILFVANATTGQDAVNSAEEFNKRARDHRNHFDDARWQCTGRCRHFHTRGHWKALKFEGIGEKIDDFQVFNPSSMADRILGMGDTINLVQKSSRAYG